MAEDQDPVGGVVSAKGVQTTSMQLAWQCFREFELLHFDAGADESGTELVEFIAEWESRLKAALAAGLRYADTILAYKLLAAASLTQAQLDLVFASVDLTTGIQKGTLLSQVMSLLYQICPVKAEDDHYLSGDVAEETNSTTKAEDTRPNAEANLHGKRKNHRCDSCDIEFSGSYLLKQHVLVHHKGLKPFQCPNCAKTFARKTHLQTHERIHYSVKPFACDLCPRAFATQAELRRHTNQHLGIKPFACADCGETFVASSDLHGHRRTAHGMRRHQCDHCPKMFKSRAELDGHQAIHLGEKKAACHICNKLFLHRSYLRKHQKIHTGERPYQCELCSKAFRFNRELKIHTDRHNNAPSYQCEFCQKSYFSKGSLDKHRRLLHAGEPPQFQCEVCSQKFRVLGNLKKHMMIHTGERPFACQYCRKAFIGRDTLERHIRVHTGERPYQCALCPKSFAQRGDLKKHQRTHELLCLNSSRPEQEEIFAS